MKILYFYEKLVEADTWFMSVRLAQSFRRYVFCALACMPALLEAQHQPVKVYNVSVNAPNQHLAVVQIAAQTRMNFSYNSSIIDSLYKVSFKMRNAPLNEILARVFSFPFQTNTINTSQIIISRTDSVYYSHKKNIQKKIEGVLLGYPQNEPLSFASVAVKNNNIGTIANSQGRFSLLLDSVSLSDTLLISALGYEKIQHPVSELVHHKHVFILKPYLIPIQEVIIRRNDPKLILISAIQNIPANYPGKHLISECFYREYVLKNDHVSALYEVLVEQLMPPLESSSDAQFKLIKGLRLNPAQQTDTVLVKLKGGLYSVSLADVLKYKPAFLDEKLLDNYIFNIHDIISDGHTDAWVISIAPSKYCTEPPYTGEITIDMKNYAIIKVDVHVNGNKLMGGNNISVYKKTRGVRVKTQHVAYLVEYKPFENAYCLSHVRSEIGLKIRKRRGLFNANYKVITEYLNTQTRYADKKRFKRNETLDQQSILYNQFTQYPESYWEQYNTLLPDATMLEIMPGY